MDNECELVSLARDNALDGGSLATDGGAATVRERGDGKAHRSAAAREERFEGERDRPERGREMEKQTSPRFAHGQFLKDDLPLPRSPN